MAVRSELKPPDVLGAKAIERTLKPAVEKIADAGKKTKAQKLLEKLGDAFKHLADDLDDEPLKSLDPKNKLSSVAQAKQLAAKVESAKVKELGKAIGERYADVKEHVEDLRELLGKDRAVADALKVLGEMVVDGHAWSLSADRYISRCVEWVGKEQTRLAELESGATGASPETTRMIQKTRAALKMVRSGAGEVTYPFIAADCKTDLFIFVAADATGGGAEGRVKEALGDAGKNATVIKGDCGLLDRKVFFASPKLSGGRYAVRFQQRLQKDIGQRLPIAVGTDKSALETVDADDFADPLDFLIAQRGPLASRAKTCKARREAIVKQLKKEGILAAGGVNARQAENLLDRADTAAANSDLSDFDRALDLIQKDVVNAFLELKKRAMRDEIAFRAEFKRFEPTLTALRKDVMDRIEEVKKAVEEEVLEKEAATTANARRAELRRASQEFDKVYERIQEAKANAWAEDLFAEGTAAIEALRKTADTMTEALRKEREGEAEARRRKEKEARRAAGAKGKDGKDGDK